MLAEIGLELPRSLPVDVEQYVAALAERLLHRRFRGAVAVTEDIGPFDELAGGDHRIEPGIVDEMIIDVVALAGPLGPRRRADRHGDLLVRLEQHPRDGRLTGARRRGEDDQQAAPPAAGLIVV